MGYECFLLSEKKRGEQRAEDTFLMSGGDNMKSTCHYIKVMNNR